MKLSPKISTEDVITIMEAKLALLRVWEMQPPEVQLKNRDYIRKLAKRIRTLRVYISHRKDATW